MHHIREEEQRSQLETYKLNKYAIGMQPKVEPAPSTHSRCNLNKQNAAGRPSRRRTFGPQQGKRDDISS